MSDVKERGLRQEPRFDAVSLVPEFEQRFPEAMQLLRIGGVHPIESAYMTNPYTGEEDTEDFRNVGEHNIAVAFAAGAIGGNLLKQEVIFSEELHYIVEQALTHDAAKRFEVMRKKAGVDPYSEEAYGTVQRILEERDVLERFAQSLAQSGRQTGHRSLKDFLALDSTNKVKLIEGCLTDKIIHLADDITYTSMGENPETRFLTFPERMQASRFRVKYPFLWTEGLAFDTHGNVVEIKDIEKAVQGSNLKRVYPYIAYQAWVARQICKELKEMISPNSSQDPEEFVKNLINQNLQKSKDLLSYRQRHQFT